MSRADMEHAAELLARLVPQATPGPWRDSTVDGNRYGALVADKPHSHRALYGGWALNEAYGGCLVGESHMPQDRRLMATMRNVADFLPDLLLAVAHEDPPEIGRMARAIAAAVVATHRPTTHPATAEATPEESK